MKEKTIYALGFFDGVHRGHQLLLKRCRELADQFGCKAGAITFAAHPDAVIRGIPVPLLNTPRDRSILLKELGKLDTVEPLPFDETVIQQSYAAFFRMMVDEYGAAGFVCGDDFRFGHRGLGTGAHLLRLCRQENIPCDILPKLQSDGQDISSQRIRTLLQEGNVEKANELLGHPHLLTGTVEPGRQIGRTIGIPTANLLLAPELNSLKRGVYACKAFAEGKEYLAVTNVGTRPTVNSQRVKAEPWLLDFSGDLYGKTLRLEFYKFLRPEEKFPSLEHLKAEIQKNAAQTRDFFGKK